MIAGNDEGPRRPRHTLRLWGRAGAGTGPWMRRFSGRAAVFALVGALWTLGVPTAARADKMISTPAEKYAVNPGGVDMRTGSYTYRQTDLSIGGTDESGGLALTRMGMAPWHAAQPFGNFSHNWDIALTMKRVSIGTGNYQNGSGPDFQVTVHFAGRSQTFNSQLTSGGFTQASQAAYAQLNVAGDNATGTYTYIAADGTIAIFRPLSGVDCSGSSPGCAFVSQIAETDGTTFTFDYDYNPSPPQFVDRARLRSVVSSRGYGMVIEGGAAGGNFITKACILNLTLTTMPANHLCPANALQTTTYAYTSFNGTSLASVTGPTSMAAPVGAVWGFTYAAGANGGYTMGFIKPGQSTPWLTNSLSRRADEDNGGYEVVFSQSFADGRHYSYLWSMTPFTDGTRIPSQTIAGGSYTDALNRTTNVEYGFPQMPLNHACINKPCPFLNLDDGTLVYQLTSGPVSITDPLNRITTSDYCDPSEENAPPPGGGCLVTLLESFTNPEGDKTDLAYDGNRNIIKVTRHAKSGTGLPDIVTSASYDVTHPASSDKPLSMTDALGRTTAYTYDPAHGGVLTETDPAVNGVTPQKRYSYAQRYAWISNGAGGYVRVTTPVWVLTQMSFCKNGNPNSTNTGCATAGDEVITTYDYGPDAGPNNLNLRGTVVDAGGLSLRACVAYDPLGNKISETKPNAALASCP
jgi:YD repeat-containing protein